MREYEENVNAILVELFANLRKKQGYTLENLADLANIHRTTIGLLERGERKPTIILALQLAKALGVPLSSLLQQAEATANTQGDSRLSEKIVSIREANVEHFHNQQKLQTLTGLEIEHIRQAIFACHNTLDIIDTQLLSKGSPTLAQLVELANLSSMVGNILSGSLVEQSGGMYARNKPHSFPDLIPIGDRSIGLELKVALETNNPKGHLVKPGVYLVFRYVLGKSNGEYIRKQRGDTVWIWECRVGQLQEDDFSNTMGDSGKTAVITSPALEKMSLIYFVPHLNPYVRKSPKFS